MASFCIPAATDEGSCGSTPLPAFGVVKFLDFSHPNRYVVMSHCFSFYFPDDRGCGASFHMLICHLYVFFGEVPVQFFCPFFNQVTCFLIVKCSLCVSENSPVSDSPFENISSPWLLFLFSDACDI